MIGLSPILQWEVARRVDGNDARVVLSHPPPRDLLPMARVRCVAELDRDKSEDVMSCACAGISCDTPASETSSRSNAAVGHFSVPT
jgi:hypothetical protein